MTRSFKVGLAPFSGTPAGAVLALIAYATGCAAEKQVHAPTTSPIPVETVEKAETPPANFDLCPDAPYGGTSEEPSAQKEMRVMSYNIKSGLWTSLEEIAETIRAEKPDIVGLQEVDERMNRSGKVNQAQRLGQLTGMASLFNAATSIGGGRYGLAVLSRWPILTSRKIELTSRSEQRILVIVDILGPGDRVIHFAVTHLGLQKEERSVQAEEIYEHLAPLENVILVGDFNEEPWFDVYTILTQRLVDAWAAAGKGNGYTFPSNSPTRRIDWILTSPDLPRPTLAWVPTSEASDHRPVVAQIPYGSK